MHSVYPTIAQRAKKHFEFVEGIQLSPSLNGNGDSNGNGNGIKVKKSMSHLKKKGEIGSLCTLYALISAR